MSATDDLRNALFTDSADTRDLSRLGGGYGVPRPRLNALSDDLYRSLIQAIAWRPKTVGKMVYDLMEIFFGPANVGKWKVFEVVPNRITIELPRALSAGSLATNTYLQQDLSPPSTALDGDHTGGVSSLTVLSTTGFAASGVLALDKLSMREELAYSAKTATTFTLVAKTKKHHLSTVQVTQYIPEAASSSYAGDYFGVTPKEGTLAANVAPTATSFTLNTGHALPAKGRLVIGDGTANREHHYCTVTGNVVTIADTFFPQVVNAHSAGAKVTFFDLEAAKNEASTASNGSNPVILDADSKALDLISYLNLIKASGVDIQVRRIG